MSDSEIKLEVTKAAQDQVKDLIKAQKPGTAVRVFLQSSGGGGGCGSGGCGPAAGDAGAAAVAEAAVRPSRWRSIRSVTGTR